MTPEDEVAMKVDSLGLVCQLPGAFATNGNTPPVFSTPAPPTPTLPPTPLTLTGEQARLRVWVAVRNCFDPLPPIETFTAYEDIGKRWLVEGRRDTPSPLGDTAIITYGLWVVDAGNGGISPYDSVAASTANKTDCYKEP